MMCHIGQAFGEREKRKQDKERKEKKERYTFALFQSGKKKVRTTNKRTASKTCISRNH